MYFETIFVHSELRSACADLYEARGLRGFWLGYIPSVTRDVPFSGKHWNFDW